MADLRATRRSCSCASRGPSCSTAAAGWAGGKLNATSILLEPLQPEESRELVDNLVEELSAGRGRAHRGRQEGHPLFAEELLAMLIDEGT